MKTYSLKLKLFISTVVACLLIVFAVSVIQLIQHRELEKLRIENEFNNFEHGAKQTIREAVWRYDWDMVATTLESQTSEVLSFMEICDNKVLRCLQHGKRDFTPYLDRTLPILYMDPGSGEEIEIGSIYLQGHYSILSKHINRDLPRLLFTNFLSVFMVAMILFYLFHKQVVHRLISLESFTRKIDLQQIGSIGSLQKNEEGGKPDEIDMLADAMDHLIDKIKDEFERRKNLEHQLNQAQKMEALGTLAGGIAHDFNNILAAILGFAELSYLKCTPGSEIHKNLEKIINAGQRARNLISQILVFSRRTEVPQEVLTLANVVEEAINLMRASLPASIQIETELDNSVRVVGDSNRLHQVIMNLVTNGGQAIGDKGGTLTVRVKMVVVEDHEAERLVARPGEYGLLEISDNGPGIPEDIRARVFEPFFTTKMAGKGTGMGLAVVHGIVQNHGGFITMDSVLGRGTSFSIYLPLTRDKMQEKGDGITIPQGKGERVILVDDEVSVLEMGTTLLENLGYRVEPFSSPRSAIESFKTDSTVDIFITDLTMPGMSGVDLAAVFKDKHPTTPVLLWTGHKDDVAAESLKNGVIDRIIQKPFTLEGLAHGVRELLQQYTK